MTAQADIHALAERTARLEERMDAKDEAFADVRQQLESLSRRVWGILVLILATLLAVVSKGWGNAG